jgi:fumarate reductase subunit D
MTPHPVSTKDRRSMAPVVYVLFGAAVSVVCIIVVAIAATL